MSKNKMKKEKESVNEKVNKIKRMKVKEKKDGGAWKREGQSEWEKDRVNERRWSK